TKISNGEFHRVGAKHGDSGKTTFEGLSGRTASKTISILESVELFQRLASIGGRMRKEKLLQARFTSLTAWEAKKDVKILTDDLRIGWREGLVKESIATAFDVPLEDVKRANML